MIPCLKLQQETTAAERTRDAGTMTEPSVIISPAEYEALRSALDVVGERVDAWRKKKN